MRVLVDTNVIIDFLSQREPFSANATAIIKMCLERKITRNGDDFTGSEIPVIEPGEFVAKYV